MKNKSIKKMIAALAAAAALMTSTVPAMAAETGLVEATNHFGDTYKVDYNQGAAEIGGRRIYFNFNSESTYVKTCGWKGGVGLKAAELADLMVVSPDWWARFSSTCPTVEQYYSWKH